MNLTREQKALLKHIDAITLTYVIPDHLYILPSLLTLGLVEYTNKFYNLTTAGKEIVTKIRTEELQYSKPLSINRGQLKSIISDCFERFTEWENDRALEERVSTPDEHDAIINEAFEEAIEYITEKKKKS